MSTISPTLKQSCSDWKTPDFAPTTRLALSFSPKLTTAATRSARMVSKKCQQKSTQSDKHPFQRTSASYACATSWDWSIKLLCPFLSLPNLSTTLHPLNAVLKKGTAWRWTAACHQAFAKVKQQIASDLVLTHFNPALPLCFTSDAPPYGIGAVMSHVLPNGIRHLIAFSSRTLSSAEKNYVQIDKEALAIVWAVRKFHTFLYGRHFVLVSDHKPLNSIFNPEKDLPAMTAARLQRYALFLARPTYGIEYHNTHDHANVDGLSHLPLSSGAASYPVDVEVDAFHVEQIEQVPVTVAQIRTATRQDHHLVIRTPRCPKPKRRVNRRNGAFRQPF